MGYNRHWIYDSGNIFHYSQSILGFELSNTACNTDFLCHSYRGNILVEQNYRMNKIQSQIGQAKVLAYVTLTERHEATGNTRHHVDGQLLEGFHGLAICKYSEDPGYYLFYCDENWIERTDTYHNTIEDAKEQAEFEFKGTIQTGNKDKRTTTTVAVAQPLQSLNKIGRLFLSLLKLPPTEIAGGLHSYSR